MLVDVNPLTEKFLGFEITAVPVQIVVTGSIFKEEPRDRTSLRLVELLAMMYEGVEVRMRGNAAVFRLDEPSKLTITIFASGKFIANNITSIDDLKSVYRVIYEAIMEASKPEYVNTIDTKEKGRREIINTLASNIAKLLVAPDELDKHIRVKNIVVNITVKPELDASAVENILKQLRETGEYRITQKGKFPAYIIRPKREDSGRGNVTVLLFRNLNMVITNVKSVRESINLAKQIISLAEPK